MPAWRRAAGVRPGTRARSAGAVLATVVGLLCGVVTTADAIAAGTGPALRIVRVGHGNVPAMKDGIVRSVDACRVAKTLPQGPVALPGDAQLAQLAVVEQEELFDGQKWAEYDTQRQIGADASNGCQPALFVMRRARAEKTCVSRVQGSTALLGALMDFTAPAPEAPSLDETPLPARPCQEKPRLIDTTGLPREDAGGAACVWNSALMARAMAKITAMAGQPATPASAIGGHDICLLADRPSYVFQGFSRPVMLMSRTPRMPNHDISDDFGEAAAPGNLRLVSFTASASIADARFSRASVDQFVHQPTRTALGSTP